MMSFSNIPVAKRTRSQWDLYWQVQAQGLKRRKRDEGKTTTIVDKSSVDECEEDQKQPYETNGSQVPSTSIEKSNDLDESSNNVSKDEESNVEGSGVPSMLEVKVVKSNDHDEFSHDESKDEESNGEESHFSSDESDRIESTEITSTDNSSESDTQTYSVDSSDDSDSDSDSDYSVSIPEKGSKAPCRTTRRKLNEVKTVDRSSKGHKRESHPPLEVSDSIESIEITRKRKGVGSANFHKTGTQVYSVDSTDDSDSEYSEEGSGVHPKSTVKLENLDESSVIELSEDEESSGEESHSSLKETDGLEEIGNIKYGSKGYGSSSSLKTGTQNHIIYLSDDSDSDDIYSILDEQEDEDLQEYCKYHLESQNDTNTYSFRSTEDDESENDKLDDCDFSLLNKSPNKTTTKKQSPIKNVKEKDYHLVHKTKIKKVDKKTKDELNDINDNEKMKPKKSVWPDSDDEKEKNHLGRKTNMKKKDKKPVDESDGIHVHEKSNSNDKAKGRYMKVDKANVVKNQKSKKGSRKDYGRSVNAMLDSIIVGKESVNEKEGDDCLPLKFRFDDSEDEALSQVTNDFGANDLFEEMDFALDCEDIGSYKTPPVENQEKDHDHSETSQTKLCESGDHRDIYLEEQTGMRCRLCGAIILESRFVISKLANYAADRSKRTYVFDGQQLGSYENMHFKDSDSNQLDVCKQTKGTVWELIPQSIRARLYPHQEEGFEFLWENLAGTTDLSRLHKLGSRGAGGGGGCIISHAPGTGKTLLTIVFMESFLKRFPKCCPVIVAPASMLLTWEHEFKKWKVGFSFINLNNSEFSCKEMVNGSFASSRRQKDMIRAMKIKSWSDGGSVLGVSYNLYGKLAGDTMKNSILEKMGNVLLDMPGLVVLDEGHTPRNQNSNIWNTLLRLKTKNRVILSGTPFQNNFRELFNTLRLVRPATAMNEKNFADIIHQDRRKKSRGGSTSEDIEKLKLIIQPFVHVHKGDILERKLPGLRQIVVLLNPSPFQKGFIENLGNFASTFEHEHKVALVSVHPSLILHCSLSKKEEKSTNKEELEKMRLYPEHGVKTRFVMELVRLAISLHEKVLIFSQYNRPLELLKDQMTLAFGWEGERETMVIKGKTNQKLRQTIINEFNDPNSKVKVLLASTRCCSEGIHLYGASRVVLLDVVWNPSVEKQAISRAYRIGQKKVVYTYNLMTAGTSEEDKYDRQFEKVRLAEKVFSSRVMAGVEPMRKSNMDGIEVHDKVLERMVDHQELKIIFKRISCVENQTRI